MNEKTTLDNPYHERILENARDDANGSSTSSDLKIKIAIGFGVACAAILIAVFIVLVYKLIVQARRNKKQQDRHVITRTPSFRESDFSRAPQQRRHRPLMKTDSSTSDINIGLWRSGHRSPSSESENGENENVFSDPIPSFGKLEFAILYDTAQECLRVNVYAAHQLAVFEATTYVEVFLLPDKTEKHQTKVKYKDSNPLYDESFEFDVAIAELPERTLQFCLYNYDGYSRHQAIGEVFHTFDVNVNMEEDKSIVYIKEIKKDQFIFREESPTRIGEILVSLCYLPTSGRLTFVVLKARLSSKEFKGALPNPFVKVSLVASGRQIKKTKTSIMRRTLQPVYNEAFVFDIPVHRLSDVSLLVRVLSSGDDDGQERKRRSDHVIGKSIVGPDAMTSIGLHHWNCMMTSPRKPIAQWHPVLHI